MGKMKKRAFFPFFLIFFAFSFSAYGNVSEGSEVPSFTLAKLNGSGSVSSSSFQGITLLDFWASWCVPCRFAIRAYNKFHQQGIHVVGISIDKEESAALTFLKNNPASFTMLHDATGSVASKFGLPTMPTSYLIKNGRVIKVYPGFRKGDEDQILNDIKQAN